MAFIDKINMRIENDIYETKVLEDENYTRKIFKKFKQTPEYKQLFDDKFKLKMEELYNAQKNQIIIETINEIKNKSKQELFEYIKNDIIEKLNNEKLYYIFSNSTPKKIKRDSLEDYLNLVDKKMFMTVTYIFYGTKHEMKSLYDIYFNKGRFIEQYFKKNKLPLNGQNIYVNEKRELSTLNDFILEMKKEMNFLVEDLNNYFVSEKVLQYIFQNIRYQELKKNYQLNNIMLKEIPKDFTELFPQARLLNRHFILHIGDTNTGKTYQAIQELKEAESGTYLAPLRLLALEIQERLNNEGVPCSMTTGEEEDIIPNAKHMSSTIEKLDMNKYYDVCVIDEAQMIEDNDRGWAWTNAILGVYSERIHICMSENARNIVIKLIELCNDTYEIVEHTRNTQLVFENKPFDFKNGIQEHDALIVFSRKKVLSVATELENMGIKASVIYGALPYNVRKNEIRKFIDGETKVVVSTDAIGMGMNLPIKRIVFLESTKFDGKEIRYLKVPEVKQIAGRAGRQGMFNIGLVNSMVDSNYIKSILNEEYVPIEFARIQLPKTLLNLNMSLSEIMINWSQIPDEGCFKKSDINRDLKLCKLLEANTSLTKEAMLNLINIPFDEGFDVLENLWLDLILCFYNDGDILTEMDIPESKKDDTLETLELKYKMLDLYFSFARTVHYNKNDFLKNIMKLKEEISIEIMEKLKTKETYRTCKYCGKKLPWDYNYSICQKCFKSRRNYWD